MYTDLIYINPEHTMLRACRPDGNMVVIESDADDLWQLVHMTYAGKIQDYVPPAPPSEAEVLAAQRAEMVCRAAQMRIVLHRAGKLAQVQAIADANPEASIIWEYEVRLTRMSPFIEALTEGDFSEIEIDDLFRSAMALTDI